MKILLLWDCGIEGVSFHEVTGVAALQAVKCNCQYMGDESLPDDAEIYAFCEKYFWDAEGEPRPSHPELREIEPMSGAVGPFDQIVLAGVAV
jgi:hypothetical protein